METMTKNMREHAKEVANVAWQQLVATTRPEVICSWGVENLAYTIFGMEKQNPALTFKVNGLLFKGRIFIVLDEGADYYQIYGMKDGMITSISSDVCFDEMGEIIDSYVERGSFTQEEYSKRISEEIRKSLFA